MHLPSHPLLLHPPSASCGRDTGRERLLKRPTSLFSQHCLRNAFLLAPSAPCVDALSAGCVLHVKQAADAVRKKATRRDKGDQDTRRPHCHATRLASPRFAATPSTAPLPQHLSLLHPSTANPPPHPRSLLSTPSSTCHPSITPPSPPSTPSTIPLPPS